LGVQLSQCLLDFVDHELDAPQLSGVEARAGVVRRWRRRPDQVVQFVEDPQERGLYCFSLWRAHHAAAADGS
jgi:hypothetical protein